MTQEEIKAMALEYAKDVPNDLKAYAAEDFIRGLTRGLSIAESTHSKDIGELMRALEVFIRERIVDYDFAIAAFERDWKDKTKPKSERREAFKRKEQVEYAKSEYERLQQHLIQER